MALVYRNKIIRIFTYCRETTGIRTSDKIESLVLIRVHHVKWMGLKLKLYYKFLVCVLCSSSFLFRKVGDKLEKLSGWDLGNSLKKFFYVNQIAMMTITTVFPTVNWLRPSPMDHYFLFYNSFYCRVILL